MNAAGKLICRNEWFYDSSMVRMLNIMVSDRIHKFLKECQENGVGSALNRAWRHVLAYSDTYTPPNPVILHS